MLEQCWGRQTDGQAGRQAGKEPTAADPGVCTGAFWTGHVRVGGVLYAHVFRLAFQKRREEPGRALRWGCFLPW